MIDDAPDAPLALADIRLQSRPTMLARVMQRATHQLLSASADVPETTDARELPHVRPLEEYRNDPEGFCVRLLGVDARTIRWSLSAEYRDHDWDGTPDPLVAIMDALKASSDVCVEAGTGTQKSHTVGMLILWFIACWQGARVFTFAPKEEQLRAFVWMEIGKLWPRFQIEFPYAVLTDLRIRMRGARDASWGAQGYAVGRRAGEDVSVNAQGMHAEHMMLVYEETPGIPRAVIEAGENTSTAPHNLRVAIGNPDSQLDALHLFGHDQFGKPRDGVVNVRISALDHPNVVTGNDNLVPGAASRKSVATRRKKYGETGRLYQSRVRGLSPAEAEDALIKLEWVQRAQQRWADENDRMILSAGAPSLGVDVANSEDGDEAATARGKGSVLLELKSFQCPDANRLGYDVHLMMREFGIADEYVGIDRVGVGAGCVNELRRLGHWVQALGGGDKAVGRENEDEMYDNLRSQMLWVLREDLRLDRVALPPDEEMAQDLVTTTWKSVANKIIIESKDKLKKRLPGGRSPNKGDAVVYWNWVRDRVTPVSVMPKRAPTMAEREAKNIQRLRARERRHGDGTTSDDDEQYTDESSYSVVR